MAEVTAIGKAVIFIPYPFAADNHQVLNARALAETGAAEMIVVSMGVDDPADIQRIEPQSPNRLEEEIHRLRETCVQKDQSLSAIDQMGRDVLVPHIVQVIHYAKRLGEILPRPDDYRSLLCHHQKI